MNTAEEVASVSDRNSTQSPDAPHPPSCTCTLRSKSPSRQPLDPAIFDTKDNVTAPTTSRVSGRCMLLELPSELRLMIFEYLTPVTKHVYFNRPQPFPVDEDLQSQTVEFTIVTKSIPGVSLLATCKQLCLEAWNTLIPHMNDIKYEPPRILLELKTAGSTALSWLNPLEPITFLIEYASRLEEHPYLTYYDFLVELKNKTDAEAPKVTDYTTDMGLYKRRSREWVHSDPVLGHAIKKLAHQLAFSMHMGKPVIDIGLTSIKKDPDLRTAKGLFDGLRSWLRAKHIRLGVCIVPHMCVDMTAGNINRYARALNRTWPSDNSGVISPEEWERDWARG